MKTLKKLFYCLLMFGLLLAIGSTASAQTADKKSLTLDGAVRVIAAAKAEASKVKAPSRRHICRRSEYFNWKGAHRRPLSKTH